jgi:hypothetical protein
VCTDQQRTDQTRGSDISGEPDLAGQAERQ